jgi:transaldolase
MAPTNAPQVKIFADGADIAGVRELCQDPRIAGFTTNPTLMRQAGVTDYEAFGRDVLEVVGDRPVSFEVLSDEFDEMESQALKLASWGPNVFVKIPITNSRAESSAKLITALSEQGVNVNVTAIMTEEQIRTAAENLCAGRAGYVSVFAGRIADSGRDPLPIMRTAVSILQPHEQLELIWASPREVLNIVQAASVGCHVITVTHDLLKKLPLLGRDLDAFSLDTVQMFYRDAVAAGLSL